MENDLVSIYSRVKTVGKIIVMLLSAIRTIGEVANVALRVITLIRELRQGWPQLCRKCAHQNITKPNLTYSTRSYHTLI